VVVELEKLEGEGGGGCGGGGEGVDPGEQAVEDHLLQLCPAQQVWRKEGGMKNFGLTQAYLHMVHPPDHKGIVCELRVSKCLVVLLFIISVVDPDPDWIRINWGPGRFQEGKIHPQKKKKVNKGHFLNPDQQYCLKSMQVFACFEKNISSSINPYSRDKNRQHFALFTTNSS
jgi:hypothetical protein